MDTESPPQSPSLKRKLAEKSSSNSYSPSTRLKTKYHELNLAQKIQVIKDNKKGLSQRKLAVKYKISYGKVNNIFKAMQEYINADLENRDPNAKRMKLRKTTFEDINELMYKFGSKSEVEIFLLRVQF